jgi:hypothetical protein
MYVMDSETQESKPHADTETKKYQLSGFRRVVPNPPSGGHPNPPQRWGIRPSHFRDGFNA